MKVLDILRGLNGYPVPTPALISISEQCGLTGFEDTSMIDYSDVRLKRAKAYTYLYLSLAPNVSQGGISYSFTAEDKNRFRKLAAGLFGEIGDEEALETTGDQFGWLGEDF